MTTAELDFPPIEAPPPMPAPAAKPAPVAVVQPAAVAPLSIKDTVLAQFKDAETGIVALADKYRSVAYDCTTTKGMAEAKAARADLRDNGRLLLTKTETRIKGEVNDLKRVMSAEVERLVAIVQPVEDAVDAQIKAEEKRKADEKAERERLAAERKAKFDEAIAKIRRYLVLAQQPDMTAERIQKGIDMLAAQSYGAEWAEFAVPAAKAQCETLEGMRQLHAAAVAREAEAARLESQRIENERLAAELAEQKRQQDEAEAELKRKADELAAAEAALAEKSAAAALATEPPPEPDPEPAAQTDPDAARMVAIPADDSKTVMDAISAPAEVPVGTTLFRGEVGTIDAGIRIVDTAIKPATTLAECQAVLADALALCDEMIVKPPTKKQAVALLARVAALRDRGGLPRVAS